MKQMNWFKQLIDKLFITDKWNIGYVHQTPGSLIHKKKITGDIQWLKEDTVNYTADPCAIVIKGKMHLYYEELNLWRGKGVIMVTDGLTFEKKKRVSGIMDPSVHLSYPCIFKERGKFYCIPETSAAKQVALYGIDGNDPGKFKKLRVILNGEAFVDSSIIFYQQKYWLFTSRSGCQGKLFIYHSDTLFGSFKAHSLNPIAVADHASRSAGNLFIVDERLYMPTQNPQKRYGGSVMINEITKLSESEFQYKTDFELLPQSPYEQGLHTVNFANGLLIVDGKREIFSPFNPIKKSIRRIKNFTFPLNG